MFTVKKSIYKTVLYCTLTHNDPEAVKRIENALVISISEAQNLFLLPINVKIINQSNSS